MKIEFDENAFEDLAHWMQKDRKKALRIVRLIRESARTPFSGTGKPQPLRHGVSRRIDTEHRLVYRAGKDVLHVLACRFHYE